MHKIVINDSIKITMPAIKIPEDCLFRDKGGNLYMRVEGGAIWFDMNGDGDSVRLVAFTEGEVEDTDCFRYFSECRVERATMTISVNYQE